MQARIKKRGNLGKQKNAQFRVSDVALSQCPGGREDLTMSGGMVCDWSSSSRVGSV